MLPGSQRGLPSPLPPWLRVGDLMLAIALGEGDDAELSWKLCYLPGASQKVTSYRMWSTNQQRPHKEPGRWLIVTVELQGHPVL